MALQSGEADQVALAIAGEQHGRALDASASSDPRLPSPMVPRAARVSIPPSRRSTSAASLVDRCSLASTSSGVTGGRLPGGPR